MVFNKSRIFANRARAQAKRAMLTRIAKRVKAKARAVVRARRAKTTARIAANRSRAQAKRAMLKRVARKWKKKAVLTPQQRTWKWTRGMTQGQVKAREAKKLRDAQRTFGSEIGRQIEYEGVPFSDYYKRVLATISQGDRGSTLLKRKSRYGLAHQWHDLGLDPRMLKRWADANPHMNQKRTDHLMQSWQQIADEGRRTSLRYAAKMSAADRRRARLDKIKITDDKLPEKYRW